MPLAVTQPQTDTIIFGFDSAWSDKSPGAICALAFDSKGRVTFHTPQAARFADALDYITEPRQSFACAIVALDQPIIVPNQEGMRAAEREVKRQRDSRIRSMGKSDPKVVKQVSDYQELLAKNEADIRSAYESVAETMPKVLGWAGFDRPKSIFPSVPILVCRSDNEKARDEWLWGRLQRCKRGRIAGDDVMVIDGGGIGCDGLKGNGPPWSPDGDVDETNLSMVFQQILA